MPCIPTHAHIHLITFTHAPLHILTPTLIPHMIKSLHTSIPLPTPHTLTFTYAPPHTLTFTHAPPHVLTFTHAPLMSSHSHMHSHTSSPSHMHHPHPHTGTITLDTPLQFDHMVHRFLDPSDISSAPHSSHWWGDGGSLAPEVGLLTHNIVIQGEEIHTQSHSQTTLFNVYITRDLY